MSAELHHGAYIWIFPRAHLRRILWCKTAWLSVRRFPKNPPLEFFKNTIYSEHRRRLTPFYVHNTLEFCSISWTPLEWYAVGILRTAGFFLHSWNTAWIEYSITGHRTLQFCSIPWVYCWRFAPFFEYWWPFAPFREYGITRVSLHSYGTGTAEVKFNSIMLMLENLLHWPVFSKHRYSLFHCLYVSSFFLGRGRGLENAAELTTCKCIFSTYRNYATIFYLLINLDK